MKPSGLFAYRTTALFSFFSGAFILCLFSFFQKQMINAPVIPKGFIVPFCFGGICGLVIGLRHLHLKILAQELETARQKLEQQVREKDIFFEENVLARTGTENALETSENKYKMLVETTGDIIIVHDENGVISYVNQKGLRFGGFSSEEALGRNVLDFLPREEHEALFARMEKRLAGVRESFSYETVFINADGERISVDVNSSPIYVNGKFEGSLIVARDITARKQMEKLLRENEEKLNAIVNTLYSGIILVNEEGIIIYANQRMAQMFLLDMEEIIGSAYPGLTHETQFDEAEQKMQSLINGEVDHVFEERRYIRHDGTVFWGLFTGSRLLYPDGTFWCLVGNITDITDRVYAEIRVKESERRYRTLAENFPDGALFLFNRELRYLFCDGKGLKAVAWTGMISLERPFTRSGQRKWLR